MIELFGELVGISLVNFVEFLLIMYMLRSITKRRKLPFTIKIVQHAIIMALITGTLGIALGGHLIGRLMFIIIIVVVLLWLIALLLPKNKS